MNTSGFINPYKTDTHQKPGVVGHTLNPRTREAEAEADRSEFKANLVYIVSSRSDPVSKQTYTNTKPYKIPST